MKHLKKFNESNDPHYKAIQDAEYASARTVDFDIDIIEKIKLRIQDPWRLRIDEDIFDSHRIITIYNNKRKYGTLEIFQSEDEWFFVRQEVETIESSPYNEFHHFFKCDQTDGLLNLLLDYNVISKN